MIYTIVGVLVIQGLVIARLVRDVHNCKKILSHTVDNVLKTATTQALLVDTIKGEEDDTQYDA